MRRLAVTVPALASLLLLSLVASAQEPDAFKPGDGSPLEGTKPLTMEGDIASQLVDGADRFLLRKIDETMARRETFWKRDFEDAYERDEAIEPNVQRLAHILGVRDERVPVADQGVAEPATFGRFLGKNESYVVSAFAWPAFGDVTCEGLMLTPKGETVAHVIAIPDADQTPEQIAGLAEGVPPDSQFARRLAESGCQVYIPTLINRKLERRGVEGRRGANVTNREFLNRSAFELGRHLIGYEVQKVLAVVDHFMRVQMCGSPPIGIIGYGEGGMLALYAAALDQRIAVVCVSGYVDDRKNLWQEPADRNVFGLLEQFGDAELIAMYATRAWTTRNSTTSAVIVEAAKAPELTLPSDGGAPGRLVTPKLEDVRREVERAKKLVPKKDPPARIELIESGDGTGPFCTDKTLDHFLMCLDRDAELGPAGEPLKIVAKTDPNARQKRLFRDIDRHNQQLLAESPYVRKKFMGKLDTSSLEAYEKSSAEYRKFFYDEVIGRFDDPLLPPNARSRKTYEAEKWNGYEVVLDVWPDVIAYGILLVPKDIKPGQRRPVVVCQHGLEGRPQHVIGQDYYKAYKAFAAQLAERGFVTFAPQNLYIFKDRFRTLQRKANPIGKTLFSIIVPQHQQIVDWLQTLPFVDPERIGFYGLSYGGKSAMRIPALVTDYSLSICSGDFNDWVWKNASTRAPCSYVWTGEYEIYEFDLGSTFNYSEMAALICPRPFMVERGHFDGVATDERVGYEYAKVRHLYAARLKIPGQTEIEWFDGPHTINGQGSYRFLHRHLDWPEPGEGK